MLLYLCGGAIPYTFPIATWQLKKLLSEELREIIERMQESDRRTQELLNGFVERTDRLLKEAKVNLDEELG